MTMIQTQGPTMSLFKKAKRPAGGCRTSSLPTTYSAVVDERGVEVEITDKQIRRALESAEDSQLFPFGSRRTARGRYVAAKAPARKLHS